MAGREKKSVAKKQKRTGYEFLHLPPAAESLLLDLEQVLRQNIAENKKITKCK